MKRIVATCLLALVNGACIGVTDGGLAPFRASGAGPADADGGPLTFVNHLGYPVTLTRASVRVSAVRFNEQAPISAERESSCIKDSLYVAEVNAPLEIDLLSASPTAFPEAGLGLQARARVAEVWLSGNGNVDISEDKQPVFSFEGEVVRQGVAHPFNGRVTIGGNRKRPPLSEVQPGSNSICGERIVTGLLVDWVPRENDELVMRVDPREIFADVDFSVIEPAADGSITLPDDNGNAASVATYEGLRKIRGVYSFEFRSTP